MPEQTQAKVTKDEVRELIEAAETLGRGDEPTVQLARAYLLECEICDALLRALRAMQNTWDMPDRTIKQREKRAAAWKSAKDAIALAEAR